MNDYLLRLQDFFETMPKKIFVLDDPGPAEVLRLLGLRLQQQGHMVTCVREGWSRRALSCPEGWGEYSTLEEALSRPHASPPLVLYGSCNDVPRNHALASRCEAVGAPTLFVYDTWKDHVANFLDLERCVTHLPTRLAVINKEHGRMVAQRLQKALGKSVADRIDILGQPAITAGVQRVQELSASSRRELMNCYNPERKTLVLFLLQPIAEDFLRMGKEGPGYDQWSTFAAHAHWLPPTPCRVLVKSHPRQEQEGVEARIAPYRSQFDVAVVHDEPVEHLLAIADLVVGMTSTALHTAIDAGKKVVSVQQGRNLFGASLSDPRLEQRLVL